ncbi:hypothetical protein PVAG01_11446 [Phlyctema vagabunda]|uniref:Uncharacterized protein n=1 Tax=Phlyctema vagabunda TaxID=108571 RepID=A0ABR4P2D1_9HELO
MSSDSFAAVRNIGLSSDLEKLAEVHLQHDLTEDDRKTLFEAAKKPSRYALIGSLVGLGLGAALAWKLRANRVRLFDAVRAMEKPTHVKFGDGRLGQSLSLSLRPCPEGSADPFRPQSKFLISHRSCNPPGWVITLRTPSSPSPACSSVESLVSSLAWVLRRGALTRVIPRPRPESTRLSEGSRRMS